MKFLVVLFLVGFSIYGFACSSSTSMGFCQNIEDDTTYIALGVKLGDYIVYDSTQQATGEHIVFAGMPFRIIETIRGNIPYDTITVWTEGYSYMCTWGTLEFMTGDTLLIRLSAINFSIDTLEDFPDYSYPNTQWYFTNYLRFSNDTLRGLVHEDYRIYGPYYPPYHPDVSYHIHNVAYQDLKQNIQNGLTCYDYTSIEEKNSISFYVYPNPCSNILYLNIDNLSEYSITINDAIGEMILTKKIVLTKKVDVSFLNSGIYFLNIQDGKNSKSVKFLKWAE